MNMTIEQQEIYQKASEETRRKFIERLRSLPKETTDDLTELFQQYHSEDTDEKLRDEIAQTVQEIIMPESMIVNLKDEFELTHESDYVRNKLSTYRQNVGSEIKRIRLQLNLSQIELAEKAGISQSHVCRLEKGVHVPEHSTIERIATAMDVSPSQIDPGFTDE